jgi:hypothetical protein
MREAVDARGHGAAGAQGTLAGEKEWEVKPLLLVGHVIIY